ncbi:MAG: ABC transporter permease [Gammaproteobacteria bacterium]|nr:ABC transporter permease [Gammaproteobacteria bacterium]MBT5202072.1 ABC transporter permease [Gammaproteobacteria bacterium]MBT5603036.1 ABC transporter permease [Gammaproteobacteria bacterium]MBT6245554.1 ABC transporter permease [Gammaproteobacteria bacterium]
MLIFRLAIRNLLRQKRRTILTGLSMTGGYMLFVLSMSLVEGSWGNLVELFTLDHTGHVQIHRDDYLDHPKLFKTIRERPALEAKLSSNQEILGFAPRIYSAALAYGDEKTAPTRIIAVDPEQEPSVSRLPQKVLSGSYFNTAVNDDGYFQAMIGEGLATKLDMQVGSELVLISQGADGSIANDIFIISGIVGNKNSFNKMTTFLPLNAAQEFLALSDSVHEYALKLDSPDDNTEFVQTLDLENQHLTVSTWQEVESTFYRTMLADKQGNQFMMVLVTFLVFIAVLNTVLMTVLERTREFGVLRAIGCRPLELVKLIFLETTLLACFSVLIGLILMAPVIYWFTVVGIKMAMAVDMGGILFDTMRGEFSSYVFFTPMAFIILAAGLISIPPGLRAARIQPRDALGSH